MSDLMARALESEILDGVEYTDFEYKECLEQLRRINTLTQGYAPTLRALRQLIEKKIELGIDSELPITILDLGFGAGDVLIEIAKWAKKNQIAIELHGIDLNSRCLHIAHENLAKLGIRASLTVGDGLELLRNQRFDIIVNSLMTHHLSDSELRELFSRMSESSHWGWISNDLIRHPIPYLFVKLVVSLFPVNRLIRNDAPLSVRRSRTIKEIRSFLATVLPATGLHRSRFFWQWSFRYSLLVES